MLWRVKKTNKNYDTQLKNITQKIEDDPKSLIYTHNDHKIRQ